MSLFRRWLVAAAAGLLSWTCSTPAPPVEASIQGDAEALRGLLRLVATLEQTPLGDLARRTLPRLEGCTAFASRAEVADLERLLDAVDCRPVDELDQPGLAGHDLAFVLPSAGDAVLRGDVDLEADGSVQANVEMSRPDGDDPRWMLLPASSGVPSRLNGTGALIHGHWRSDRGLDLASMVDAGSELDRLWGLKADLLSAAVLDGTVEWAIYGPEPSRAMPPMALAFGVRRAEAAVVAAEALAAHLAETWSVQKVSIRIGDRPGGCLTDLRILPDLAPCYVVTTEQLVIGWNIASLEHAVLGRTSGASADDRSGNEIRWFLSHFPEADRRITRAMGLESGPVLEYPWSTLVMTGRREGRAYRFDVRLEATSAEAP